MVQGAGCRVQVLGSRASGLGFWIQDVGFRVQGLGYLSDVGFRERGFRNPNLGGGGHRSGSRNSNPDLKERRGAQIRVQDCIFRVQGLGVWFQVTNVQTICTGSRRLMILMTRAIPVVLSPFRFDQLTTWKLPLYHETQNGVFKKRFPTSTRLKVAKSVIRQVGSGQLLTQQLYLNRLHLPISLLCQLCRKKHFQRSWPLTE